jgi:hypothetical protein
MPLQRYTIKNSSSSIVIAQKFEGGFSTVHVHMHTIQWSSVSWDLVLVMGIRHSGTLMWQPLHTGHSQADKPSNVCSYSCFAKDKVAGPHNCVLRFWLEVLLEIDYPRECTCLFRFLHSI